MNAKQLKFYQLFADLARNENVADEKTIGKSLKALLELDYTLAQDVWDYLATVHEAQLQRDDTAATTLGKTVFDLFYQKAATRCVKTINELPSVRRAVFQYSPDAGKGNAFQIMVDLLVANKVADGEELLRCLQKNDRIEYGPVMKALLERIFIEILKKSASKKIEMSKKLSTLLLTYIAKIKTDERAMLQQRIRETL